MQQFAETLGALSDESALAPTVLGRPVLDRTNLQGRSGLRLRRSGCDRHHRYQPYRETERQLEPPESAFENVY